MMKKYLSMGIVFTLLIPQVGVAQITKSGPYLSSVTQTSIIVSWQTDISSNSEVEYGLTEGYGFIISDTSQVEIHSLKLTGLNPSTTYHYRVKSGETASEDNTFETAVRSDEDYMFVAYGDTRTNPNDHQSVVNRIIAIDPKIVLNSGDLVETGSSQSQWDIYFQTIKDLAKNTPIYSAIGNHEGESSLYYNQLFLPHNNPDSTEAYYSFDYGRCHFIALNTNISYGPGSAQYHWLESDLQAASSPDYIFVCFHHPPYSSGTGHGSDLAVQNAFCPLFETYGVDVVFNGHDHIYERTHLINGVTYIVTGGGGAPLHSIKPTREDWSAYAEVTLHCVKVWVTEDSLKLWMIRPNGTVGDSATILGANATLAGLISEEHTYNSITVTAPYSNDRNGNGSAILEHKLSRDNTWWTDGDMTKGTESYTLTITGLMPDSDYDIRVTYHDPDGIMGVDQQLIENIHTWPILTSIGMVYTNFSVAGMEVIAEYTGDGNGDGTANLEHKLSSETAWIDDGPMQKDNQNLRYSLLLSELDMEASYDFRITYTDPDGIIGDSPQTLLGVRNLLSAHKISIVIDGNIEDWTGIPPTEENSWILDGKANEFIWRDTADDDLGDGGDAANASDNPEAYSYPTHNIIFGGEGDVEAFWMARDEKNLYFLIDLAGKIFVRRFPFSIILMDRDGAASGRTVVDYSTEVTLGGDHAWDYEIAVVDQRVIITDAAGNDLSAGAVMAQNIDMNLFEVAVPFTVFGDPEGKWHIALLQTLNVGIQGNYSAIEVNYTAESYRGGGGIDGEADPDVYDLIGAGGIEQYGDLNNYTDSTFTVMTHSWVELRLPAIHTGVREPQPSNSNLPKIFSLCQNYPNPFNPTTEIRYSIPRPVHVKLVIYNVLGQRLKTLVNERREAGTHTARWDGKDENNNRVASGVYLYHLMVGEFTKTRKMVFIQ